MADSTTSTRPQIDDPERQPLLAKQPEVPAIVVQETDGAESEIPLVDEEPKKRTSVWMIVWYIVIFSLCAVGLGFFIKAFIDADDMDFDLKAALFKALGGGVSGAAAMVLQVLLLMPLRTVMNYQYRFGTSTVVAIYTLYADGGMGRYYQGLAAALVQGPVSRFGDTAANAGILALLASNAFLKDLPPFVKTVFASLAAAVFRMTLTPVDTLKTTLQAQGKPGWGILARRIRTYGIWTLWYGALATAAATFVGHYPWFATYNTLQDVLPPPHSLIQKLLRQAFIGFVASIISDSISNSLRVVKTYRQVNDVRIGYFNAARAVVAVDGLTGLFGRGLKTRIIANGCQSIMFSILWKLFMDLWDQQGKNA